MILAIEHDLTGVDSPIVNDLLRSEAGRITIRPRIEECSIVLFTQVWRREELGFTRDRETDCIEAETVVITGPAGDACVYVSTQLLYHVVRPSRRFFIDVAAQCMRGKGECIQYEGRDSEDEEAFDFEVAGALARVSAAVRMMQGKDAERVAKVLRDCAERVEATGRACDSAKALGEAA